MRIDPADIVSLRPAARPEHGPSAPAAFSASAGRRLAWVDLAKGWCIVLVVLMHSTLGVGLALDATGWTHAVVAFAKPFRMPDFFLISGLFAAPALRLPWRDYLDKRVVHFAYFYALWLAIVLAAKAPELGLLAPGAFLSAFAWGLIEPFSSLWFIQVLPLFFVAYRFAAANRTTLVLALVTATILHLAAASTPDDSEYTLGSKVTAWTTANEFALFFIYFLLGGTCARLVFALAEHSARKPLLAVSGLVVWGLFNTAAVSSGAVTVPGLTILLGLLGAAAVVTVSSILARTGLLAWLAYCGRNSLVIYLAFVLPMAAMRVLLVKTGLAADPGLTSVIVTATAILVPLGLERLVRGTPLRFLFVRPAWARLPGAGVARLSASIPKEPLGPMTAGSGKST